MNGGGGGSGGSAGNGTTNTQYGTGMGWPGNYDPRAGGTGGAYGGGGGASWGGGATVSDGIGGGGAVRIIWPGTTRSFPSTQTGNL